MSKILRFPIAPREQGAAWTSAALATARELLETDAESLALRPNAREELNYAIWMLDLAAQHARQITKRLPDPIAQARFDVQIDTVEQLIHIARDMTEKL